VGIGKGFSAIEVFEEFPEIKKKKKKLFGG
jgi:hypothetical protein